MPIPSPKLTSIAIASSGFTLNVAVLVPLSPNSSASLNTNATLIGSFLSRSLFATSIIQAAPALSSNDFPQSAAPLPDI